MLFVIMIGIVGMNYIIVSWAITLEKLKPSDRRFKVLSVGVIGGLVISIWIIFGKGVLDYYALALVLMGMLLRIVIKPDPKPA